jgi:hypothetical protein
VTSSQRELGHSGERRHIPCQLAGDANGRVNAADVVSGAYENSPINTALNRVCVPSVCPNPEPSVELATAGRDDGRRANGTFAPGWPKAPNARGSLKDGGRSEYAAAGLLPSQQAIAPLLAERRLAYLSDLGGTNEVSAIKSDLLDDYQRLRLIAEAAWDSIAKGGIVTGKGRQRAVVGTFVSVTDRLQRLAEKIGLERRTKPTRDAMAYMNSLESGDAA